jgi:hypothetical protein
MIGGGRVKGECADRNVQEKRILNNKTKRL